MAQVVSLELRVDVVVTVSHMHGGSWRKLRAVMADDEVRAREGTLLLALSARLQVDNGFNLTYGIM